MKYTLCLNLQQHLDLAGNAARQCIGPDGGTCGAADLLAKELYQQAGSTVHNLGLLDKVICAVYKSQDFDKALDLVQVADLCFNISQKVQRTVVSCFLSFFHGQVPA